MCCIVLKLDYLCVIKVKDPAMATEIPEHPKPSTAISTLKSIAMNFKIQSHEH